MTLTVTRQARAYRLWVDTELLDAWRDHVAAGWITNIVGGPGDPPTQGIRFQRGSEHHITDSLDRVVVSDTALVQILTPDEYNALFPDHPLPNEGE